MQFVGLNTMKMSEAGLLLPPLSTPGPKVFRHGLAAMRPSAFSLSFLGTISPSLALQLTDSRMGTFLEQDVFKVHLNYSKYYTLLHFFAPPDNILFYGSAMLYL